MIVPLRTETKLERRLALELAEQIAATLSRARVADITLNDPGAVVPRRAAWSHKQNATDQYCLHGRLTRRDDRVRITLWLMDAKGLHVWGDSYDGATDNLFDLLRGVADSTLMGVVPGITGAEIVRIQGKDAQTLAAREMLTQALPVLLKLDGDSSRKGFEIASRAMELDPDDSLPFAWGAYCQARLFNGAATDSVIAARAMALQLSARADAHDAGDHSLVLTARAAVAYLLEFYADSEHLAQRALAMDPASGWAHERAGQVLVQRNPDAAIRHFSLAMQLHGPFMPQENCLSGIGQAHHHAGRPEEALRWIRRAFVENSRAEVIHRFLIGYEEKIGHHTEAQELATEICRMHPEMRVSRIAECYPHVPVEYMLRAGVPP